MCAPTLSCVNSLEVKSSLALLRKIRLLSCVVRDVKSVQFVRSCKPPKVKSPKPAKMYFRLCSMLMPLLIVLELSEAFTDRDSDLMDATFRQRFVSSLICRKREKSDWFEFVCYFTCCSSRTDWEKVWHQESHTRCREKLLRHLFWACDNDIYRMERRTGQPWDASGEDANDSHAVAKRTGMWNALDNIIINIIFNVEVQ